MKITVKMEIALSCLCDHLGETPEGLRAMGVHANTLRALERRDLAEMRDGEWFATEEGVITSRKAARVAEGLDPDTGEPAPAPAQPKPRPTAPAIRPASAPYPHERVKAGQRAEYSAFVWTRRRGVRQFMFIGRELLTDGGGTVFRRAARALSQREQYDNLKALCDNAAKQGLRAEVCMTWGTKRSTTSRTCYRPAAK